MKAKRILAMVLSVAMVATSGNFTLDAYAMENRADWPVNVTEDAVFSSEYSVSENSVSENDTANHQKAELPLVSEGDASNEEGSDGENSNGAVSDETVSAGDVSQGDSFYEEVSGGDAGDGIAVDENIHIYAVTTDCFTVTEDGTLAWKNEASSGTVSGTVSIPAEAVKIPVGIFDKNTRITGIKIPEGSLLAEIEAGAFEGSGITSIEIPDAVTEIKDRTFKDSALQVITFSTTSNLQTIGEEAFAGSALGGSSNAGLKIPGTVTEVGYAAFRGCTNMGSVNLQQVQKIGANAFKGCSKLATITWSKNLTEVGASAFAGVAITTLDFSKEDYNKATVWGDSAFEQCTKLKTVKLNKNMSAIPSGMFRDCTALATLTLPTDFVCTVIGAEAFSGCSALKTVTIPAKVSKIESAAFAGCTSLATVIINQRGTNDRKESDIILADGAFPQKSDLTMKGYDGTVEDYADKMEYTFVTLYPANAITLTVNNKSHGTAKLSAKTGREGDVIQVTVTPDTGYRLRAYDFTYNDNPIETLVEETKAKEATDDTEATPASWIFSFVMPDEDVEVNVTFETDSSYGTLTASFENQDYYTWSSTAKKLTMEKSGLSAKMVIESSKGYNPGNWQFTYKSGNTKVARVDEQGVIYACGSGKTKITATLKSDTSKTVEINVYVENDAQIDNWSLQYSNLGKAARTTEVIDGKTYTVIRYTKGNLAKNAQDFTVSLNATSGSDSTNLYVESAWASANTDLAEPDAETVGNNQNVIHVKQGTSGETAITVTVTNGETGKKKETLYEESFIVRVIDTTPRLVQSTINVNALSSTGTEFEMLSVYGYEVQPSSLSAVRAVTKNNTTTYEPFEYVTISYSNGEYYMNLTKEGKAELKSRGKDLSYTNVYIEGEYSYTTSAGTTTETFRTLIKSLVLTEKTLKPTVKMSGKINLFFNSSATREERGEVVVTQSLKDVTVKSYELISTETYQELGTNTNSTVSLGTTSGTDSGADSSGDALANNFVIDEKGVISRSSRALMTDAKGKAVTSGYLKIVYDGYSEPSYVKITIPTQNTKPAYVLSKTKATVNGYSQGYGINLQLLNKKTKKAISLEHLTSLSFDSSASGTTMYLFNELDTAQAKATDTITLQINKAQKGKAVINVQMDTWNEPLKFTFNLNVTSSVPKVKAKTATLTLNNLCVGRAASTALTVDQEGVTIIDIGTPNFVGKSGLAYDADMITLSYEDGVLSAVAADEVSAGSYRFSVTPTVMYSNGVTESAKSINVTVKVINTNLSASVKPATVTLNNNYMGREEAVASYTIKNMPAGESIHIVSNQVTIAGINEAAETAGRYLSFDFGTDVQTISVRQTSSLRKGTYKFRISNLKVEVAGQEVAIQPFTIGVKILDAQAKLVVKTSGTLNLSNSESSIVYNLVTSNVGAKIEKLVVWELNTTNNLNTPYAELQHFKVGELLYDADGGIKGVSIMAKDGVTLDAKQTYKLRIGVVLAGAASDDEVSVWSSDLKITPKQILPKVKTDVTTATLYAGVSADSSRRSQEILITKTSEQTAVISEVILADSNSDNLQKAFKVTFDSETQRARITLIRPDLLVPNTEYDLTLEVRVAGQMDNTTGTQFNIKVKVLK